MLVNHLSTAFLSFLDGSLLDYIYSIAMIYIYILYFFSQ